MNLLHSRILNDDTPWATRSQLMESVWPTKANKYLVGGYQSGPHP